jgi:uncharacterized protein YodC (DUF2158 family)
MAFKKGDNVQVKGVIPQGPVLAMRMDEEGNIYCLVEWVDQDGNSQQRWFAESQLAPA